MSRTSTMTSGMMRMTAAVLGALALLAGCASPPPSAPPPTPVPSAVPDAAAQSAEEVRSIVASDGSSCAVSADGSVWCWGDVFDGWSYTAMRVEGIPPAERVALGLDHGCVLTRAREVWCWGREPSVPQPEAAGSRSPLKPQRIEGLSDVRALDAGGRHSCVIDDEARLHCWKWGQSSRSLMRGIGNATDVALSEGHGCVLASGAMHCWGWLPFDYSFGEVPMELQAGAPAGIVDIAVGNGGHCAQLQNGRLYCWGQPCPRGQSWHPPARRHKAGNYYPRPRPAPVRPSRAQPPARMQRRPLAKPCEVASPKAGMQAIDVGSEGQVCAVIDGALQCWKRGSPTLRDERSYRDVDLGMGHGCAIRGVGRVACWGSFAAGRLGRQSWTLRRYRIPLAGPHADMGHGLTCWLDGDKGARCWSHSNYPPGSKSPPLRGELLSGTEQAASVAVMRGELCVTFDGAPPRCTRTVGPFVKPLEDARRMALSSRVRCAITAAGGVVCDRRLGKTPAGEVRLGQEQLEDVVSLDAGLQHVCAVSAGRVICWGTGYGRGENAFFKPPSAIGGIEGAREVATASASTCALAQGRVWCWGAGALGQLGDGLFRTRDKPAVIEGLAGVRLLRAGAYHYCAIDEQDAVWCWGSNSEGQLGDGTTRSSGRPIKLADVGSAKGLALGRSGTCVLRESDSLCWGSSASWSFAPNNIVRRSKELAPVRGIGAPQPARPLPPAEEIRSAPGTR